MSIRSAQFVNVRVNSIISIHPFQLIHLNSFISIYACLALHFNSFISIDKCQFAHVTLRMSSPKFQLIHVSSFIIKIPLFELFHVNDSRQFIYGPCQFIHANSCISVG